MLLGHWATNKQQTPTAFNTVKPCKSQTDLIILTSASKFHNLAPPKKLESLWFSLLLRDVFQFCTNLEQVYQSTSKLVRGQDKPHSPLDWSELKDNTRLSSASSSAAEVVTTVMGLVADGVWCEDVGGEGEVMTIVEGREARVSGVPSSLLSSCPLAVTTGTEMDTWIISHWLILTMLPRVDLGLLK